MANIDWGHRLVVSGRKVNVFTPMRRAMLSRRSIAWQRFHQIVFALEMFKHPHHYFVADFNQRIEAEFWFSLRAFIAIAFHGRRVSTDNPHSRNQPGERVVVLIDHWLAHIAIADSGTLFSVHGFPLRLSRQTGDALDN